MIPPRNQPVRFRSLRGCLRCREDIVAAPRNVPSATRRADARSSRRGRDQRIATRCLLGRSWRRAARFTVFLLLLLLLPWLARDAACAAATFFSPLRAAR